MNIIIFMRFDPNPNIWIFTQYSTNYISSSKIKIYISRQKLILEKYIRASRNFVVAISVPSGYLLQLILYYSGSF